MVGVSKPEEVRCSKCGAKPRLVHKMMDPRASGGTLRMYKCRCGEQIWVTTPD
jgi:DNA-directed RNA polymerase subunit M/transcription elongation factor TFIIS